MKLQENSRISPFFPYFQLDSGCWGGTEPVDPQLGHPGYPWVSGCTSLFSTTLVCGCSFSKKISCLWFIAGKPLVLTHHHIFRRWTVWISVLICVFVHLLVVRVLRKKECGLPKKCGVDQGTIGLVNYLLGALCPARRNWVMNKMLRDMEPSQATNGQQGGGSGPYFWFEATDISDEKANIYIYIYIFQRYLNYK